MFLKRQGFPEEGEFVICTVTNIPYNSVFAKLNEYGKSGLIHISEISPGRIRNIRDYVVEGKVIVCVVLRINQERGYIDLSLRRVNEMEKKKKIERIKQEQKAEKIIENYAKPKKLDVEKYYHQIADPILKKYEYVHSAFYDVVEKKATLEELGVPKDIAKEFESVVLEKIHPKVVSVEGTIKIEIYSEDGVEVVKKIMAKHEDERTTLLYEGGGKYRISIKSKDYKKAEKLLKEKIEAMEKETEQIKGKFEFNRIEKK